MQVVDSFQAGDEVPEWLFSVVPMTPTARAPKVVFTVECTVLETDDAYILVPLATPANARSMIELKGGDEMYMSAAGKKVLVPLHFEVFGGKAIGGKDLAAA